MAPTPTLAEIEDVMRVAGMGGDLDRLSIVCLNQAEQYQGEARERLIAASAALAWGAKLLAAMEGAEVMPGTSGTA